MVEPAANPTVQISSSPAGTRTVVNYLSANSIQQVINLYKDSLTKAGWNVTVTPASKAGGFSGVHGIKDKFTVDIQVGPATNGTTVITVLNNS